MKIDYTIPGTRLPELDGEMEYRCSHWEEYSNATEHFTGTYFSYGSEEYKGEIYVLAERVDYKFTNYYMFKLENLNKLTMHTQNNNTMEKEIIGYKCPMDLWDGQIKKGELIKRYDEHNYRVFRDKEGITNVSNIPKELAESWEPCYKEEFTYKVGDYLNCIKDFVMGDGDIDYKKGKIYLSEVSDCITDEENIKSHRMTNAGQDLSIYFRHATPEEIAKVQGGRIVMAEGFELVIKDNRIIHEKDNTDITGYVKKIKNWWANKLDSGYDFIIKPEDIIISKTGCQEKKTTLKQWLDLHDKIK